MIVVFVEEVTERLVYTLDFIFKDRKIPFQITNDPVYYNLLEGFKFNYSNQLFDNGLHLQPSEVLFSEEIVDYQLEKAFFYKEECISFNGILDPIASIFYVLSRYEEYIIAKRDVHDRFQAVNSLQYQFGWLQKCICDRWCEDLISFMESEHKMPLSSYKLETTIVPTFDIDNVRAFDWKEGVRTLYGKWKDWIGKDKRTAIIRREVLQKTMKDPYDTFDYIENIKDRGFDVKVFWLIGDFAKYDRNVSSLDNRHRKLIEKLAQILTVGIHPSYKSNLSTFYLEREIERLAEILSFRPEISRQHFLKVSLPFTYRNLINYNLYEDYSMGYAEEVGFRAGTARPFYFFDLPKNQMTTLQIHSFCYMDVTLNDYKKLSVDEARKIVQELLQEVQIYGGEIIPLWHNESIGNYDRWKGWYEILEYTLNFKNYLD